LGQVPVLLLLVCFEVGSCAFAWSGSNLSPPTCTSKVTGIRGVYYHTWLGTSSTYTVQMIP
jgi:hypothetical protein